VAQASGVGLPSQLLASLPYLVTILVLGMMSTDRRMMKLKDVALLGDPCER
jgi:simple sugar transport system permease protein